MNNRVNYRRFGSTETVTCSIKEFANYLENEIDNKN